MSPLSARHWPSSWRGWPVADSRVFAINGDATQLVAAGGAEGYQRQMRARDALLRMGMLKLEICLEGGSADRAERAQDFIATYAALGIKAKRVGSHMLEVGNDG